MFTRTIALAGLLILIIGLCAPALAEDPFDPIFADTVKFGCPVNVGLPVPDSIGMPLYIWADDSIGSFTLGFVSHSQYLTWSSFSHEGSVMPGNWTWPAPYISADADSILVGAIDLSGVTNAIYPRGLIGTLYLHVDPEIPNSSDWDIDTSRIGGSGVFILSIVHNGPPAWAVAITPEVLQCGTADVHISSPPCGDANSDGTPNITDAVFLIQWIFAGGPGPDPESLGDSNCDGTTNITDAVYLIQWIFAGGPAPCELCP